MYVLPVARPNRWRHCHRETDKMLSTSPQGDRQNGWRHRHRETDKMADAIAPGRQTKSLTTSPQGDRQNGWRHRPTETDKMADDMATGRQTKCCRHSHREADKMADNMATGRQTKWLTPSPEGDRQNADDIVRRRQIKWTHGAVFARGHWSEDLNLWRHPTSLAASLSHLLYLGPHLYQGQAANTIRASGQHGNNQVIITIITMNTVQRGQNQSFGQNNTQTSLCVSVL